MLYKKNKNKYLATKDSKQLNPTGQDHLQEKVKSPNDI